MSKGLEKEYRELMAENVPDLWDRIDAGLEPKKSASGKGTLWRKYRTWGTVAAAVLLLAVTGPVLFMQIRSENTGTAPEVSDGGNEADTDTDDAVQEEAFPEYDYAPPAEAAEDSIGDQSVRGEALQNDFNEEAVTNAFTGFSVRAEVKEILEKDGRTIYLVRIEEAKVTGFAEGDLLRLYGGSSLTEEPVEGESYFFDFTISIIGYGATEYIVTDVRQE